VEFGRERVEQAEQELKKARAELRELQKDDTHTSEGGLLPQAARANMRDRIA
jgi:hypothetical protein